jgi:2-dehydropantoate 2-reductase
MRYVIYGAGAIGGAIGARLFESGRDVVLIARGEHLEVMRTNGLMYRDPDRARVLRIPVVDHPGAVVWRDDDVVLLAMKSQATEDAVRELAAVAPAHTAVICAQNGVENERVALRRFANVYAMCVMMPASHLDPGVVEAESLPIVGVLDLGRYPEGSDHAAERIATDLSASGFRSAADPAVMGWKYEKLLLNLSTAVRAMCGPDGAGDGRDRRVRELVGERLRAEALACYGRAGIVLPEAQRRDVRWDGALTRRPVAGSRALAGSAWQSLARRTGSSEADYVNGEITFLGRMHGVPTPTNDRLVRLSNDAARRRRPPGSLPITELADELGLVWQADATSP